MDSLSFRLVRPMNRLTQVALLKHLSRGSENLTSFNAKLVQRYALLDYVDHRAMLALLTEKARRPLAPVAFASLRQILRAVQRFPLDFEVEKRGFETALLNSVFTTPPDTLSSAEYGALWSLTTQITEWNDVLRLSEAFPLQGTLPHQSEKEFRAVLNQMLVKAVPIASTSSLLSSAPIITTSSAGGELQPRGLRLLRELVGAEVALERALDGIVHRDACWTERESAVYTFVGVVHALGRWPSEHISGEEAWRGLGLRPTTFHDVDLYQLLRMLLRLQSPVVPDYVRASLDEAISTDLWRCYSELPNEPVAAFFGLGESRPRCPVDEKAASGAGHSDTAEANVVLMGSGTQLRDTLRRFHERVVESQLRRDGPALSLAVLVNLLIGSAFLEAKGEIHQTILTALKCDLASSSSSRRITSLQAAIIATCLDRIQQQSAESGASSMTPLLKEKSDVEEISKLLVPFLNYAHLKEHGCARSVAILLSDCPRWTKEWQLEEGCFNLLYEHAHDGFTKMQLQGILESDKNGSLSLPTNVKETTMQRAAEAPNR